MSATLTWFHSGNGAKTGTTNATLIADIVSVFNSKLADSNYSWQVASSDAVGPNVFYIVLKRKSGSNGRILLVIWASAPAGNNSAILDTAPTLNALFGAYFPNGNVDTPSNLTASSGTIMGNDTGAVKVWGSQSVATIYATSILPFYFDSAEAVVFGFQNPASASNGFYSGAGTLLVDGSDNAYDGVFSTASSASAFGSSSNPLSWTNATVPAGTATAHVRTNFGASNRVYFMAWDASGGWAGIGTVAADPLQDTSIQAAWFVPVQLLGQTKGEGFVLKLRQLAHGPFVGTLTPFAPYNTAGPVVAARQISNSSSSATGQLWSTNFKL